MSEPICAIATPPGPGGVGVVRISGDGLDAIARKLIGNLPEPRLARLVTVRDASGEALDQGLALYFPGPRSYTGEDVLELQLHGSPVVLDLVVRAGVAAGARRAAPGEFSQRAFLNDKLDLAQAEAIADLIAAGTEQAARAASRSLRGAFSTEVNALMEDILELRVYIEAALDFADEDIDFLAEDQVGARLRAVRRRTTELLARARAGRMLNDGLRIAIVGKPNAGKSSLFNALARREAAIVTEIPGTTRDIVRETVQLAGVPVTLADTAGLRETDDPIEREGVRRAHAELAEADLVLWVTDITDPDPGPAPRSVVPVLRIANKIDRPDAPAAPDGAIPLSALTGEGLEALDRAVTERFELRERDGEFTARQRHIEAIETTSGHLDRAHAELEQSRSGELVAEELKLAADALGEITGRIHSDDLLGRIFSSFCIGK